MTRHILLLVLTVILFEQSFGQVTKESYEKAGILPGFTDYLIILAIVLSILGLFLALTKRNNYEDLIDRILKSERLKDLIRSQNTISTGLQKNISLYSDINAAKEKIGDLDFQIKVLTAIVEELTKENSQQQTNPFHQEGRQPEPKTEIFFLPSPNSDCSFDESSASISYKEGASIYRFTKQMGNIAKFQIDSKDASVKLALQYRDKRIDPVCNAVNAFNPRATRIYTITMGEAELKNGKWIVTSKAVIRYED